MSVFPAPPTPAFTPPYPPAFFEYIFGPTASTPELDWRDADTFIRSLPPLTNEELASLIPVRPRAPLPGARREICA